MSRTPRAPLQRLAAKPRCRRFADVELALLELAWIEARSNEVRGKLEQEIAAATSTANDLLRINGVSFADRKCLLESAIAAFAESHKQLFVRANGKSIKFDHGVVGFRLSASRVTLQEKQTPTLVLRALGWTADTAAGILKRLGVLGWIRINAEIDVSALKAAVLTKRIAPRDLEKYGLTFVAPKDEVQILPAAYCARNH